MAPIAIVVASTLSDRHARTTSSRIHVPRLRSIYRDDLR